MLFCRQSYQPRSLDEEAKQKKTKNQKTKKKKTKKQKANNQRNKCCGLIVFLVQFLFPFFCIWFCMIMSIKQGKIKIEPRIKLGV